MYLSQKKDGRCFINNAKGYLQSTFARLETGRCGGGCDEEFSHCVVRPLRIKEQYDTKNVSTTDIFVWNLKVDSLIDPEKKVFVASMGDSKILSPAQSCL